MSIKSGFKISLRIFCFVAMLLAGVGSFNLFYLSQKLQMLRLVNEFHEAQMINDKAAIDRLLTDDFTETGASRTVQTPEIIYKKDLLKRSYAHCSCSIEAKHLLPANIFNRRRLYLSAAKEINLFADNSRQMPPIVFIVTYTFAETADGLKISRIERHF